MTNDDASTGAQDGARRETPVGAAGILATPPATAQTPPAQRAKRPLLTLILGGALIATLAFAGGVLTGRATVDSNANPSNGRADGGQFPGGFPSAGPGQAPPGEDGELPGDMPSGGGGGFGGGGFGGTAGTITKIDGDTITIETEDGQTYQIEVGSDTSVTLLGDVSDLAEGDDITVVGTPDEDGLITDPRSIIEGSSFGDGGFGGGPSDGNDNQPSSDNSNPRATL